MVLGAGLGSRLRPFTDQIPKPLIPVLGVPCIEFSLMQLQDAGVKNAVVNIHKLPELMRNYLESNPIRNLQLETSDETKLLLGSAGGFRKTLDSFHGKPFFALNADVITNVNLHELQKRHFELREKHGVKMTLALGKGSTLASTAETYREILTDPHSGLIIGFGEKKLHVPFYLGIAIFEPSCFQHLAEGKPAEFVPDVLEPMIRKNEVGYYATECIWFDVGSPELWWKSHGDLENARIAGKLPRSWSEAIEKQRHRFFFDQKNGVVDYDQAKELGKNYIRLNTVKYEIQSLGPAT